MSRLEKGRKITQAMRDEEAWEAITRWHWRLDRSYLHPQCPRSNRSNRHFLQVTGTTEFEMSSGAQCRGVAWRCPRCGDTYEIRTVKRSHYAGWTQPFVLHNGEYAGNLDGHKIGETNDTSD